MGTILKIVIAVVVTGVIGYIGVAIYANFFSSTDASGAPKPPDVSKAQYVITVNATGQVYLTSDFDTYGNVAGTRTYILHSYYEYLGKSYAYRSKDLPLDEKIFGEITVHYRNKQTEAK